MRFPNIALCGHDVSYVSNVCQFSGVAIMWPTYIPTSPGSMFVADVVRVRGPRRCIGTRCGHYIYYLLWGWTARSIRLTGTRNNNPCTLPSLILCICVSMHALTCAPISPHSSLNAGLLGHLQRVHSLKRRASLNEHCACALPMRTKAQASV